MEDAIYDSYAMRKFMEINFLEMGVPNVTLISAPSFTQGVQKIYASSKSDAFPKRPAALRLV